MHLTKGVESWSKYIRQVLGMFTSQLAKRLGKSQSSVSGQESREIQGGLSINKLHDMAEAMECDFVYSFIPKKSLETIIYEQAKKKVLESIELSDTHMSLEDQQVSIDPKERLEDLIEEKIYSKYLWD